jgi:hypothetical protein
LILILAWLLLLASLAADAERHWIWQLLMALLLTALFVLNHGTMRRLSAAGMMITDTPYQHAAVMTVPAAPGQGGYRVLLTDTFSPQSVTYVDSPNELSGGYTQYFRLALHFVPRLERILMIGGGAYTVPKYFAAHHPQISMDVVEIDPGITQLARDYFFLAESPALRVFHSDARVFLKRASGRYDAIFIDAFQSGASVPFHLTTREMFARLYALLNQEGMVVMNLITAIEGEAGRLFRAEFATLKSVFPWVYAFPVGRPGDGTFVQNVVLAAFRSDVEPDMAGRGTEFDKLLGHLWTAPLQQDAAVVTDDYAPVEAYMLPVYQHWRRQQREE